MKPSRFADADMRQAVSRVDGGMPLVAMCRTLGITPTTFYRWRRKFGAASAHVPDGSRELRDENHRLKQLVADLSLEAQALKDLLATSKRRVRAMGLR